MTIYFVIEAPKTSTGEVNFVKTEQYSLAKALSYYYARKSAYIVDTTYPTVSIALLDSNLNVIEQDTFATQYVAPAQE